MVCKLIILVRKKKGITEEEFHTYWSKNHPKVFLKGPQVQEKVISYTQYHANKTDLTKFKSLAGVPRGSRWDGIVNITVGKLEDLEEVPEALTSTNPTNQDETAIILTPLQIFEDEDYLKEVADDEAQFLDREDALLLIGYDEHKKLDVIIHERGSLHLGELKEILKNESSWVSTHLSLGVVIISVITTKSTPQ